MRGRVIAIRWSVISYGLHNGVTELIDHRKPSAQGPDFSSRRLHSIWFGAGAVVKQRALQIAGVMVAFALWRNGQMILGNIASTIVIFGTAIGLILRESVEPDRLIVEALRRAGIVFVHFEDDGNSPELDRIEEEGVGAR